jgi:hypothetical protein
VSWDWDNPIKNKYNIKGLKKNYWFNPILKDEIMKNKKLIKKTLSQPDPIKNKYNIKKKYWLKKNNKQSTIIINIVLQGRLQ